jgi:hypothetical protein
VVSEFRKSLLAYLIALAAIVVTRPIDFNNQASGLAAEIDYEASNGHLTSESPALEKTIA